MPHMDSLPDFLALIANRPASEVEHALAVAAAVAHHIDQQKGHDMAKNAQGIPQDDVKVKHSRGCVLDGKTDEHTHPQQEWRDLIDRTPQGDDGR